MGKQLQFDKIGGWSELKLEILKKYADAYSRILSAKRQTPFFHVYIDAFAGSGKQLSKESQKLIPGSPLNALAVQPQFREFHLNFGTSKASNSAGCGFNGLPRPTPRGFRNMGWERRPWLPPGGNSMAEVPRYRATLKGASITRAHVSRVAFSK